MARWKFELGDRVMLWLAADAQLDAYGTVVHVMGHGRYVIRLDDGEEVRRWGGQLRLVR